ncbi:MAG: glutathione transferase GstA [Bacteriovoracaceae bacterium]
MKLYFSPGACSLASHICLAELNSVYECEVVDMKTKTVASGDFSKINVKGQVPTLKMDNGEYLTEGVAIMNYIANQKPEANLFPKFGTMEYYRGLELMNYVSTELHKGFSPLWGAERMFTAMNVTDATIIDSFKTYHINNLATKFDYLNTKLANNDFFMGKNFSTVDAYVFTVLNWTNHLKIDLSKWSNITGFMDRVYKRPSVQAAMKQEGILK